MSFVLFVVGYGRFHHEGLEEHGEPVAQEYGIEQRNDELSREETVKLSYLPVWEFVEKVGDGTPTPGGGSVAALFGAMGAALCAMVARLTVGKEKYRGAWEEMEGVKERADALSRNLLALVERDAHAYSRVMACFGMPKATEDEKEARQKALQEAIKEAALVPLETLRAMAELTGLVAKVIERGNSNCLSDGAVACQAARAAAVGAFCNVKINLSGMIDRDFSASLAKESALLLEEVMASAERIDRAVKGRL